MAETITDCINKISRLLEDHKNLISKKLIEKDFAILMNNISDGTIKMGMESKIKILRASLADKNSDAEEIKTEMDDILAYAEQALDKDDEGLYALARNLNRHIEQVYILVDLIGKLKSPEDLLEERKRVGDKLINEFEYLLNEVQDDKYKALKLQIDSLKLTLAKDSVDEKNIKEEVNQVLFNASLLMKKSNEEIFVLSPRLLSRLNHYFYLLDDSLANKQKSTHQIDADRFTKLQQHFQHSWQTQVIKLKGSNKFFESIKGTILPTNKDTFMQQMEMNIKNGQELLSSERGYRREQGR